MSDSEQETQKATEKAKRTRDPAFNDDEDSALIRVCSIESNFNKFCFRATTLAKILLKANTKKLDQTKRRSQHGKKLRPKSMQR
jgi:hypothetical protein